MGICGPVWSCDPALIKLDLNLSRGAAAPHDCFFACD